MNGTIEQSINLNGNINNSLNLIGSLENPNTITGSTEGTLEIVGSLENELEIVGSLIENNCINGELVLGGGTHATYGGSYEITPTSSDQTLNTNDKIMTNDVLVGKIPYYETSNEYGKTIYIG